MKSRSREETQIGSRYDGGPNPVRVFVTETQEERDRTDDFWNDRRRILRSAERDQRKKFLVVPTSEGADLILFVGNADRYQRDLRRHPLVRQFPEKCFVLSVHDNEVPFIPGVYASVDRRNRARWRMRAGFYPRVIDHDWIEPEKGDAEKKWLFSFVGSTATHPLRRGIADLKHAKAYFLDTTGHQAHLSGQAPEIYRSYQKKYAQIMRESTFVLCPRGNGVSSFRLFEAIKAGRTPVIVSDDWIAPAGPKWESFSIRVPESRLQELPAILESRSADAEEMGRRAREAWKDWFSEDVAFHRVCSACLDLLKGRVIPERLQRSLACIEFLRPVHARVVCSTIRRRIIHVFERCHRSGVAL